MGPVSCANPDSFCAEAYGMLTILCYLGCLAEFTGQSDPWIGVLATDSQSLLDAISTKAHGNNKFPPLACHNRVLKQYQTWIPKARSGMLSVISFGNSRTSRVFTSNTFAGIKTVK